MLRTVSDPQAMEILTRIALGPATAAEVADALGLDPKVVRGQLRRLCRDGQVVRQGTVRRRQRPENLYAADLRANVLDAADLAGIPRRLVDEADLALLRVMFREAAAALEGGIFTRRIESALTRITISLDEEGLREAYRLNRRLLQDVLDEVEQARARLELIGEDPVAASVQILFFEYPPERWPLSSEFHPKRRNSESDRIEKIMELVDSPGHRILEVLTVFPASAGGLAGRLGMSASKVRYELDHLLAQGLVRVIRTRPIRGTVERIFVADTRRRTISRAELAASAARPLDDFSRWIVRTIFGEALDAIRVRSDLDARDTIIARVSARIDAKGFAAVSVLIEGAIEELSELRERNIDALSETEFPPHLVISGLLLFEHAPSVPDESRAGG